MFDRVAATRLVALVSAMLLLGLNGCARTFLPGPGMTISDLAQASGRCGLMSRQHGGGFAASGDYRFVAGAALISVIGDAARTSSDYNDCMLANGAVPESGKAQAAPVSSAVARRDELRALPAVASELPVEVAQYVSAPAAQAQYVTPASYRAAIVQRSLEGAQSWMRAQEVLNRADAKSRDLYLVLCGAGDESSCAMAASLRR